MFEFEKQTKKKKGGGGGGGESPPREVRGQAPENFEFSVSKTLNSGTTGNHFVDIN